MILKKITILTFLLSITFGNAQIDNESNFYTPPARRGIRRVFNAPNSSNHTAALQRLIDQVSASRDGGRIVLPENTYRLSRVVMKSNVILLIDELATIQLANPGQSGNATIFTFGRSQPISNFAILGTRNTQERANNPNNPNLTGRFTVDLTRTNKEDIFVFSMFAARNFKLSNFRVKDRLTRFQAVGMDFVRIGNRNHVPNRGVVSNASISNASYGYGLVQVQAAKNILFSNLSGTGGITLRIETGFSRLQRARPINSVRVNNIVGRDISCTNGQAAVMLSPHTINQGVCNIRRIRATSCEWGVFIGKGFTKADERADGLTPGTFSSNTVIDNVTVISGNRATSRSQNIRFLPCNRRSNVTLLPLANELARIYTTPSIAAVYHLGYSVPARDGGYRVRLSNVRARGFHVDRRNRLNTVPAVITNSTQDYEGCNTNPPGVDFYIPRVVRNTPRLQSINNQSRQFEAGNNKSLQSNSELIINNSKEKYTIKVYNLNGILIKTATNTSIRELKSSLNKGIYLLKMSNKNGLVIKKVAF